MSKLNQTVFKLTSWFSLRRSIGVVLLLAFVAFEIYEYTVREPRAAAVERDLDIEFQKIREFPGSSKCCYNSSHKPNQVLVGENYSTSASFQDIREHFDSELVQNGWTYSGDEKITDWRRDLGGRSVTYCKKDYSADLFFPGERSNAGYTYALDMSWNLGRCK